MICAVTMKCSLRMTSDAFWVRSCCQASCAALLLLFTSTVLAHQQGSTYSHWTLGEQPSVTVRVSELDLTRAQLHPQYSDNYRQRVLAYLQGHLHLFAAGQRCDVAAGEVRQSQPGWLAVNWDFNCVQFGSDWLIESYILLAQSSGPLHFARVNKVDRLLTARDNQWLLSLGEGDHGSPQASGFVDYLSLGFIHILEGWDHLAFVLGLLLLACRQRALWLLITGFTLGHSVTLVAASLDWLQPNITLIEAVIAWSIALVATEYFWGKNTQAHSQWRWLSLPLLLLVLAVPTGLPFLLWLGLGLLTVAYFAVLWLRPEWKKQSRMIITVAFGLVHGCGFAAVLSELSLPSQSVLSSLFGFNLGVEVGQIAVVLILWPLLKLLSLIWPAIRDYLAFLLLVVASYWWLLRLLY